MVVNPTRMSFISPYPIPLVDKLRFEKSVSCFGRYEKERGERERLKRQRRKVEYVAKYSGDSLQGVRQDQ
ncbi:hypothetical protein BgiBS90_021679, partial [Biomphalaria glabrata]